MDLSKARDTCQAASPDWCGAATSCTTASRRSPPFKSASVTPTAYPSLALMRTPRYSLCMQAAIIVFLGAGLGEAARHGLNVIVTRMMGTGFPYGILLVNLLGCFVMGILAGWLAMRG